MKHILFFFLIISNLYSSSLYKKLIKDLYISEDFKTYKKLTKENYKQYNNIKLKKFSIKMVLEKEALKDSTYYISIISDVDSLFYTNTKYIRQNKIIIVKLDEAKDVLYFNYNYNQPKRGEFRYTPLSKFEHDYILHYEGILYGIAYGIIFCAFLYYLVIYFSTQKRYFLFYSLMQLCVLFSLIGFTYLSFKAYATSFEQAIIDIFETLAFLFTLLFAKDILKTKKIMPKMNLVINIFIFLNLLDIFAILYFNYSILYKYVSFYIGFLIPSFAGVIAIIKGNKYAIIYTLGWFMMFCFILLTEKYLLPISGIYAIHIVAPLESLIFSFALGVMLKSLIEEQNEKEKFLIHKSKLASMGEMISNIAHQWRQPLTHLSFINMNLQLSLDENRIDKKYLKEKIEESNSQIDFMSDTINSFKDFYKPQKDKEIFFISTAVKNSIDIMKPLLEIYNIKLEFFIIKDKEIKSYKNEYAQVILNLITNAKDELIIRKIENPKIIVKINFDKNKTITTVCDNAGGVKKENLNKIFEPYFSTKDSGTGIGLYMSKTIINSHFKGELKVLNTKKGACFSIII